MLSKVDYKSRIAAVGKREEILSIEFPLGILEIYQYQRVVAKR